MSVHQILFSVLDKFPDAASLWDGRYKIPWDDPEFSRRMLKEHLSQDHDLASRKTGKIKKQVEWIHEHVGLGRARRVLDLGCGPGLYLAQLAGLGYSGCGIDFSPASIQYARANLPGGIHLVEGDLRTVDFGTGFDLVMMLYGELNVFSPEECAGILTKAQNALNPGGRILVEIQTFEAVQKLGRSGDTWYKSENGLFSEQPHVCLIENHWVADAGAAVQFFHVIVGESGQTATYRSTTKAWSADDFRGLLGGAGFSNAMTDSDWPLPGPELELWQAEKQG